jgi:hypothetical protein
LLGDAWPNSHTQNAESQNTRDGKRPSQWQSVGIACILRYGEWHKKAADLATGGHPDLD